MELRKTRRRPRTLPLTGHNSLMLACQQESKEDVRNILSRQPNVVLQRDPSGKNALHYCAENSDVECPGLLLSAAPSLLNSPDDEGYTPLHLAVISGNRTVVKYLLAKGADASAVDSEKHSCVHWATVSGDCDCLELLVGAGADPSTPDMHGAYPVHYAAQMCGPNSEMGNDVRLGLAVLGKLLAVGVPVDCVDRDGRPPLLWAASGGSSDAILALVKAGADVNAVDRDGLTALHCAASRGHVDCLETLVSFCGAELDKTDDVGCSALFYAVTLGHADCTNLLLSYGSNPNRQDNKGRTPAHCGAAKGQMETLKILSQHKANLWLRNAKGDMPLHEAVQSGRKDLVEWLLQQQHGAVNVSNSNGRAPLHIAAITNNIDMCKVLMDYGAFVNPIMRNSKGHSMTPLDAALHRGNRGCAKYLSLHGAQPASKLLEKREYSRFKEAHLSQPLELSPNSRMRLLRDTSAQTELLHSRDANVQARVEQKTSSATTEKSDRKIPCTGTRMVRCPVEDAKGKSIIAKVYVHTKRPKVRKLVRKPTAYRRDYQGEKLYTRQQQHLNGIAKSTDYGASTKSADVDTASQTHQSNGTSSRKASLYEQPHEHALSSSALPSSEDERQKEVSPRQEVERQMSLLSVQEASDREILQALPEEAQEVKEEEARLEDHLQEHKRTPQEQAASEQEDGQQADDEEGRKAQATDYEVEEEEREKDSLDPESLQADDLESQEQVIEYQRCDCYSDHASLEGSCNCSCHDTTDEIQPTEQQRRRSSLVRAFEAENHSPLSSIRSLESTIKDSGFSDDLDRGQRGMSSSDEGSDFSEMKSDVAKRRKRHVARYVVSSGVADTFRLVEDDEEGSGKRVPKPRSSSLPQLKKRDERFEICPRLLNRPTITKDVQRSLKKYQMERRLFYELQELKRKQITTNTSDEREVVQKMVERFRNHVLSPMLSDFEGSFTFTSFEKYLYEQLRKLSMGGRIPKPKAGIKDRRYAGPLTHRESDDFHVLCSCDSHKCHHRSQNSDSDYTLRNADSYTSFLPEIIPKAPFGESRMPSNRSKSWDRLDETPRKNSTFVSKLEENRTSNSLPSLSSPFPRRVPAALLAAISQKLGPDVHPEDTVVIEMSTDRTNSKMRHAFSVQELREIVARYEEKSGSKVRPPPLQTALDQDDGGPITFEIRHGRERNVFRLPAEKLKDNKKWQVTFTIGKWQKSANSVHAK